MFISGLWITGFTSLRAVDWQPARLNVLIGPNGSGKSNLLRALDLIATSAAGNLRDFILRKGGFPRLQWGESTEPITFNVVTGTAEQIYEVELSPMPGSASFRVSSESLAFPAPAAPGTHLFLRAGGHLELLQGDRMEVPYPASEIPHDETVLSMVTALWSHPAPYEFQQYLRSWAIYHDLRVDEHAGIRRSAIKREERRVSRDGQNLTAVLDTLYAGEFKETIDNAMSAAFPGDYEELILRPAEPDRIQLYLRRKHGARQDSAADLSDGTLRFLLLLTILASPDPPPLIAIDEPEGGLHPSMLPIIAEFANAAATRTQVILSTHSPQMLDAFGEDLPAATIFNWVEDQTELKIIAGEELKKWVDEYSLGRFIFSGEAAAVL